MTSSTIETTCLAPRTARFTDVADDLGITYRQADHWRRSGYVHATAEGSGTVSYIDDREVAVLRRMAVLVRAGMLAGSAASIARASVEQGVRAVDLPGGLRIVFDVDPAA